MNEDSADLDRSRAGVPHTALALIIFPQFDFRSVNRLFFLEQSRYVTEALRHLHGAQTAAADESRATARTLSIQQQVRQKRTLRLKKYLISEVTLFRRPWRNSALHNQQLTRQVPAEPGLNTPLSGVRKLSMVTKNISVSAKK